MFSFGVWRCAAVLMIPIALLGCKTTQSRSASSGKAAAGPPPTIVAASLKAPPQIVQVSSSTPRVTAVEFQEPLPASEPSSISVTSFAGQEEFIGEVLSREWLQAQVEARNPSLEAMISAWQAAAQLYPQRVALDDPMLMGMIAPESAASSFTETAYALQLNQKLPWFGKRPLRGEVAAADADAAFQDAEDTRLQIRLAADLAFLEYSLVSRLIEINGENTENLKEFYQSAQERYRRNQATSNQEVLQAELELADQARRRLELERMQQVATARINTLLRRWPSAPLPPPASVGPIPAQPIDSDLLWQTALRQRPDLAALAFKVQSQEAQLQLAYKNYLPDFDAFGRYDTFWQPSNTQGPLRAQVGVAMNLPVWREKLRAAVCEAQFRLNQRRAEFDQRSLEIQYEVIAAAQQVEESRKTAAIYSERLLPAGEQNVAAARSNYEVNKLSFIELALTQRQLIAMRERHIEAIVAFHRRAAELNRVTGGTALDAAAGAFHEH